MRQARMKVSLAGLMALLALVLAGGALAVSKAAPQNLTPPKVSGTPTVGQTLTTDDGTWSNTPTSYSYQWQRCDTSGQNCVNVANGTQKTYTLVGADRGHTVRSQVTAKNADGSATASSQPTAVVGPSTPASTPRNTAPPTVSGSTLVGHTLTASNGSWTGNPTSYSYQWQRCDVDAIACTPVVGANGQTYTLSVTDVGFRMRVAVTAKNAKGASTAYSQPTFVVETHVPTVNSRPTLTIISVRFVGAKVYARFRACDDSNKNLTIIETDSRPGKASYTRRFSTLVPPRPCGVYTRHWTPASRFRGRGRFTVTLRARDKSGATSRVAHRTFSHG